MTKRKDYNPFKMWGSYAGIIVLNLLRYLDIMSGRLFNLIFFYEPSITTKFPENAVLIGFIDTTIIGFILGWLIHSLFRRFK